MNIRDNCIEGGPRRDKDGYVRVYYQPIRRDVSGHRLAYCQAHRLDIASIAGLVVRHRCDNPPCVNPEHLELGTTADNNRDKAVRGRAPRGEQQAHSKLSADAVRFIKSNYRARDPEFGAEALARKYGVVGSAVRQVLYGQKWAHVTAQGC